MRSNILLPADQQKSCANDSWTKGTFNGSIIIDSPTKGAFDVYSITVHLAGSEALRTVVFNTGTVPFNGVDPLVGDSEE